MTNYSTSFVRKLSSWGACCALAGVLSVASTSRAESWGHDAAPKKADPSRDRKREVASAIETRRLAAVVTTDPSSFETSYAEELASFPNPKEERELPKLTRLRDGLAKAYETVSKDALRDDCRKGTVADERWNAGYHVALDAVANRARLLWEAARAHVEQSAQVFDTPALYRRAISQVFRAMVDGAFDAEDKAKAMRGPTEPRTVPDVAILHSFARAMEEGIEHSLYAFRERVKGESAPWKGCDSASIVLGQMLAERVWLTPQVRELAKAAKVSLQTAALALNGNSTLRSGLTPFEDENSLRLATIAAKLSRLSPEARKKFSAILSEHFKAFDIYGTGANVRAPADRSAPGRVWGNAVALRELLWSDGEERPDPERERAKDYRLERRAAQELHTLGRAVATYPNDVLKVVRSKAGPDALKGGNAVAIIARMATADPGSVVAMSDELKKHAAALKRRLAGNDRRDEAELTPLENQKRTFRFEQAQSLLKELADGDVEWKAALAVASAATHYHYAKPQPPAAPGVPPKPPPAPVPDPAVAGSGGVPKSESPSPVGGAAPTGGSSPVGGEGLALGPNPLLGSNPMLGGNPVGLGSPSGMLPDGGNPSTLAGQQQSFWAPGSALLGGVGPTAPLIAPLVGDGPVFAPSPTTALPEPRPKEPTATATPRPTAPEPTRPATPRPSPTTSSPPAPTRSATPLGPTPTTGAPVVVVPPPPTPTATPTETLPPFSMGDDGGPHGGIDPKKVKRDPVTGALYVDDGSGPPSGKRDPASAGSAFGFSASGTAGNGAGGGTTVNYYVTNYAAPGGAGTTGGVGGATNTTLAARLSAATGLDKNALPPGKGGNRPPTPDEIAARNAGAPYDPAVWSYGLIKEPKFRPIYDPANNYNLLWYESPRWRDNKMTADQKFDLAKTSVDAVRGEERSKDRVRDPLEGADKLTVKKSAAFLDDKGNVRGQAEYRESADGKDRLLRVAEVHPDGVGPKAKAKAKRVTRRTERVTEKKDGTTVVVLVQFDEVYEGEGKPPRVENKTITVTTRWPGGKKLVQTRRFNQTTLEWTDDEKYVGGDMRDTVRALQDSLRAVRPRR